MPFHDRVVAQFTDILTHWGRVKHKCVSSLYITGSDNGLSPGRHQAIIWTNAGILLLGPLGANFSENLIEILTFSFTTMWLKVSSAKWWPFCLGLNVLRHWYCEYFITKFKDATQYNFDLIMDQYNVFHSDGKRPIMGQKISTRVSGKISLLIYDP